MEGGFVFCLCTRRISYILSILVFSPHLTQIRHGSLSICLVITPFQFQTLANNIITYGRHFCRLSNPITFTRAYGTLEEKRKEKNIYIN